jgi:Mlc titration factor MtfA (ptsG expression regulator)
VFDFLFKKKRREELRATPLPEAFIAIIERNVPYVHRLSDADREELYGHVQVFLAEKSFEGCGGLELTDEIKVTIAAQACVLLLHRETDYYPELDSIVVYPHAYVAKGTRERMGNVVIEKEQTRLGESWTAGTIVLAWDAVKSGASNIHDGHNVVLHEFAHQLDAEDGDMDGAPDLGKRALYTGWAHVLGAEYGELTELLAAHRRSDLDAYAATNPAEFFAVVTEAFFEKGAALQRRHPELYAELAKFYKQDPAAK